MAGIWKCEWGGVRLWTNYPLLLFVQVIPRVRTWQFMYFRDHRL